MSSPTTFTSTLGPVFARFVAFKQSMGCRYETQHAILGQLDRFLVGLSPVSDLTAESFSAWCTSTRHLAPSGRRMRMLLIRQFCLYRRRHEPNCFVPDPSQFPPRQPIPKPYVFSEDEIIRLLHTADGLRPWGRSPLYRQVARLALVLFYTSGLRRGEVVRLTLSDYDPVERVLRVCNSKFNKSRIVPLSNDAARELDLYLEDRRRKGFPSGATAPLLMHRDAAYTGNGLRLLMRRLFRAADVRTATGALPRVHDLRFTFALHALLRWYRAGADVQSRLPALATYMGHVSILSTQYYLPVLDVVAEEASEKFGRHSACFFGDTPNERGGR